MTSQANVLITSIGSLAGVNLARCFQPVRDAIRLISTNSIADAYGNFLSDKAYVVEETANPSFRSTIARIVEEDEIDIVFNGRDEELAALAELKDEPRLREVAFLVPPQKVVPIFNDKYQTALFARAHGLPYPKTAFSEAEVLELLADEGLPLMAKPRWCGHASKDTFLALTEGDVAALAARQTHVLQEVLAPETLNSSIERWGSVSGMPWSWAVRDVGWIVEIVIGRDGRIASLCMSSAAREGGMGTSQNLLEDEQMRAVAEGYVLALSRAGHRGPLNLQGKKLQDGAFVPFELNARFTGSSAARAFLGCNQVLIALNEWCGVAIPESREAYAVGRASFYVPLDRAGLDQLRTKGCWERGKQAD